MIKIIKSLLEKINSREFTKIWISRFSGMVLLLLFFTIPLCCGLVYLHFNFGLETNFVKVIWQNYVSLAKIMVSSYAVTFISYMAKAYMAKNSEEKLKHMSINEEDTIVTDDEETESEG